jgi:hypothetical protein
MGMTQGGKGKIDGGDEEWEEEDRWRGRRMGREDGWGASGWEEGEGVMGEGKKKIDRADEMGRRR